MAERCNQCGRLYEATPLRKSRRCQSCMTAYHRAWRERNWDRYTAYQDAYNRTKRGRQSTVEAAHG